MICKCGWDMRKKKGMKIKIVYYFRDRESGGVYENLLHFIYDHEMVLMAGVNGGGIYHTDDLSDLDFRNPVLSLTEEDLQLPHNVLFKRIAKEILDKRILKEPDLLQRYTMEEIE